MKRLEVRAETTARVFVVCCTVGADVQAGQELLILVH